MSGKACRHSARLLAVQWVEDSFHIRCACGAMVPFDQANDGPPHAEQVAIEKRAAEIAAMAIGGSRADATREMSGHEIIGWCAWPLVSGLDAGGWLAGHLAVCIARHEDEQ